MHRCGGCASVLPPFPSQCDLCSDALLCLSCSIRDPAICAECLGGQLVLFANAEHRLSKLVPCSGCESVFGIISLCHDCRRHHCETCVRDPLVHQCVKCSTRGCLQLPEWPCTGSPMCYSCRDRDNAGAYVCHCCVTIGLYGGLRFKCRIQECPKVYGCHACCNFPRGIVCYEHSSQNRICSGCKLRYPLAGHGIVRISRLMGAVPHIKEHCPECFERIKTFVNCLLFLKPRLPNVIIEILIIKALTSLLEGSSNIFDCKELPGPARRLLL